MFFFNKKSDSEVLDYTRLYINLFVVVFLLTFWWLFLSDDSLVCCQPVFVVWEVDEISNHLVNSYDAVEIERKQIRIQVNDGFEMIIQNISEIVKACKL